MLVVEPGTALSMLHCRACHVRVQPGDRVLLAFRSGRPTVVHAHVCEATLRSSLPQPAALSPGR